jgi:hypothetical protein
VDARTVPEFSYRFIKFNTRQLNVIDDAGRYLNCASREEALRKIVCLFGHKLKVEIPPGPIERKKPFRPRSSDPVAAFKERRDWEKSILVVFPYVWGASWVAKLTMAAGQPTIFQAINKAVSDFEFV